MSHLVSTDFHVGQVVTCADPECFLMPLRGYLKGRTGVVTEVFPAVRPNEFYCGAINQLRVKWCKRNNRGKEKELRMCPRDLNPYLPETV
jgi:hypothetical protein